MDDIEIKNMRTINLTRALAGCAAGEAEIVFPGGKYIWQGFGPMKFRAAEDAPKPRKPRKPRMALGRSPDMGELPGDDPDAPPPQAEPEPAPKRGRPKKPVEVLPLAS